MKHSLMHKLGVGLKIFILISAILILETKATDMVLNAQNSNLNKQVDLKSLAILDIKEEEQKNATETLSQTEEEPVAPMPIATYDGRMTGYVYNCPKCSGRLACDSSIDLRNGNINYYDNTYGNVRIVASSKNLECGSIVSINASSVSSEPIIAIVLDRGVSGTKLDLLMPSEHEARKNVGNTKITYDVLRRGY